MRDGIEDEAPEPRRPKLIYPFETVPEQGTGEAVEVAPGVLWLRQPLGGSLQFINVWAIADGEGWAIVDTGVQTKETSQAWRAAFAGALEGKPITRVICTHLHPDHVGLAGWIVRKFDCRLWMTRLEYFQCRMLVADTGREAPEDGVRFFTAAGWDEDAIENYKARFGGFGKAIYALPDSYRRLSDGEDFDIGGKTWRVVTGQGHSPDHACLWCPELGLLISGDQVLPRISSNVSVFPTEPEADPLSDWLTSLAKVKSVVPDSVLVLPAHNDPFHGLHSRIDNLIAGHERGLSRLEEKLAEPKRVIDTFGALFARPIGPDLLGMATGEALSHLNCLIGRGRISRHVDDTGVAWYRAGTNAETSV
ncbi:MULTISPECIES: MBL fold metallo-hydrolase [unclassified Caulobacter]|uniref:MBL fold metallo-hydrolase n=1 Tax=unclassified Caulobacter TaxID=2648921 RepID=UPI000D38AE93|nr:MULTISPECIES: MBL fold metallo-hydrolase [unclassified Caulobacter]PTS88539.1 MBL fold metallo-hydrolase [Caulobacter sp. HMWF009]PTT09691.1 MBL fold metallo-hydrolase [Caulobacter sp. HMWF025]